jgi:peptidoglycan hydrolase CwlO-like protein
MKDDRGELDLTKQIEDLTSELKSVKELEESHRKLNDKLQQEIADCKRDNVILSHDNATLSNRLRDAGK